MDREGQAAGSHVLGELHLRQSLYKLACLQPRVGPEDLSEHLLEVARLAVHAIPGARGAGLTLRHPSRKDTVVATDPFVAEVDAIQQKVGEGPGITATATGLTVRSGSLGADRSWPRLGAQVGRLGVHSSISLPFISEQTAVFGSLSVYAHSKDAFDDRAVALGEYFVAPAGVSVLNARALWQAQRLTSNLQAALVSRAVIDQAIGILMSRTGCSADQAFEKLRAVSQRKNLKLSDIAQDIVSRTLRHPTSAERS